MLLGALCGCTGVDVVSILEKMKLKPVQMSMSAEAERGEEHPRILRRIWITYSIETEPPDAAKVFRAVELSAQKYCAVAATLAAAGEIRYRVLSASEEREGVFAGAGASPHP
jgi:putative redox protein